MTRGWWLFGFDENSAFFKKKEKDTPDVIAQELARWRSAYDAAISACDSVETEAIIRLLPDSKDRDKWQGKGLEFLKELPENRELRRKLHLVGSLRFWDVYPEIAGGKLRVDIMNPHFNHYYQGDGKPPTLRPPGDWGSPNPIFFLTIPAGSSFRFVVERAEVAGMPPSTRDFIGAGIGQVMQFSFNWMGFGAKTSLGYGLMGSESDLPKSAIQPGEPASVPAPQVHQKISAVPPQPNKPVHRDPHHHPAAGPQASKPIVIQADVSLPDETRRSKAVLVTTVINGKARIKLDNGEEMDASKFPPYPPTPAGRRCTVEVTTRGGKPIKAIFKGFL